MKFSKNTEGAISVFLVIILVPCLFITSMFVDIGRVHLSSSMANSSADLALNTLLTKYDADLNEWYGLIASCQDMDEFYDISKEYYMRVLQSQDLSSDEIELLGDVFDSVVMDPANELVGNEGSGVSDLFQLEAVEDVTIEPVDNANLANSVLLKEQIVEFMKYRGPITIATELISMFQNEDGTYKNGVSQLLDSKTDEPIVEAKEKFYDSESEFLSAAYKSYSYLYNNYSKEPVNNSFLTDKIVQLENIETIYQEIHDVMVHDLYNTGNLVTYNRPYVEITTYDETYDYTTSTIYSRVVTENNVTTYYIDGADLSKRFTEVENAIAAFKDAINDAVKAVSGVSYTSGTTYDIQYWVRIDNIWRGRDDGVNYINEIAKTGDAMIKSYAKLKETMLCTAGTDMPENYTTTYSDLISTVESLQNKYLVKDDTKAAGNDTYLKIVERMETISARDIGKINYANVTLSSTGKGINDSLSTLASDLSGLKEECQKYIDVMDTVINGDSSKKIKSLDKLKDLANDYESNYNNFDSVVKNAKKTDLQKETEKELSETVEKKYDKVSEEAVDEMKNRLSNIRSQYQAVIDAIDTLSYGGKAITAIKNYGDFSSAASSQVKASGIGLTKTELSNYSDTTFSALFKPQSSGSGKLVDFNSSDDYNLYLSPKMGKYNVPELYEFFYNQFGEPDDETVKKHEKEKGEAEELAKKDNTEDIAKTLLNEDAKKIENAVSGDDTESFGLVTDGVGALVGIISSLLEGDFTKIRDDAYVALYILEMLSHATYEREGQYTIYNEKLDGSALTTKNALEKYKAVDKEEKGMWKSALTYDTYNKTMTNKLINAENNGAYLCEIEYILYGKDSNKDNINAATMDIFTIRTLLNTVSGFINFWGNSSNIGKIINTVATTVAGASCGVVPAPAVKLVVIMVLVAMETCNDMTRLSVGFPVELYKVKEENWEYAIDVELGKDAGISEITTAITNKKPEESANKGEGFFYSDYITMFLLMAINSKDTSDSVLLRTADVIQLNMQTVTGNTGYALSNANTHFQLNSKLRVEPILLNMPLFHEYIDGVSFDSGWMDYEVETIRGY